LRTDNVAYALKPDATATRYAASADRPLMPRKNFIDEYIFGRMDRDGINPPRYRMTGSSDVYSST
jgi:hypothetical protein